MLTRSDFDKTPFDNDGFAQHLGDRVEQALGATVRARYRALYAELRTAWGYADPPPDRTFERIGDLLEVQP